ncbi:hypothetical protein VUR80DRAFT_716 [Thermomyces stellatus]
MAYNRIEGPENLFVGGIFALRRPEALAEKGITHVLSVLNVRPEEVEQAGLTPWKTVRETYKHMIVDVDDVDDEDILVHFPKAVRFIEEGLYPSEDGESVGEKKPTGSVYVHCAMGKSRSVSMVTAYLLWKHPDRFRKSSPDAKKAAQETVESAIDWIRRSRPMAEPNWGFRTQLELWWEMGCPENVEAHPVYKRWAYKREVEQSVAAGMAPELRFEDEEGLGTEGMRDASSTSGGEGPEIRCRKCRATLATARFIVRVDHGAQPDERAAEELAPLPSAPCPHYFIEPLSWMRPTLELGELEGRLNCPGQRCGASVGRYSWRGFQCSCGRWVTPAFSLQKGKVDVVARTVAVRIRPPPGAESRAKTGSGLKENL